MPDPRARFELVDVSLERTFAGEAEAAIVIAGEQLHLAASHDQAFDLLVVGAEWLRDHMRGGSMRSAASHQFAAYGRHAINGERTVRGPHRAIVTPSTMLEVVREELGEDAAERVRRAAARRMGVG
jgi:hypothetical protein